ncbi:hypothetical protein FRC07_009484, partial [Ceratobasidium sp. 392]
AELRALGLWERFSDVPNGLRFGFRIGAKNPVFQTYTPENHKSALLQPGVIEAHIETELAAGHYTGPFGRDELERLIGPFQTAPLGVVEKSTPGTFRIIQDFSYSPDRNNPTSLNDQIDTSKFICVWGFFHVVAQAIANAPPGTLAATMDVDAAYRQIPIHILDQPHIVFRWGDNYYVDGRVPFGAASSNGLFARCGDSMAEMYARRLFGVIIKWVNDFLFIQHPVSDSDPPHTPPRFSLEAIYAYAVAFGWPWKPSKSQPFADLFRYLGFDWIISARLVRLPESKREKFLARLRAWMGKDRVATKETEVLVGSLVHCTLVIPEGRPRLAGLIRFMAALTRSGRSLFMTRPPSEAALADVKWWSTRLSSPHNGMSITPPPPPCGRAVYSDASTSFGIGIIIDDEFISLRLAPGWKSEGRDIGWAEAIALEMAIIWLTHMGCRDASVTAHCDNQGIVFAWEACRSRNAHQNESIARSYATAVAHNLLVNVPYIRSEDNPADLPSRGIHPPDRVWATFPPPIPDHLADFLSYANITRAT